VLEAHRASAGGSVPWRSTISPRKIKDIPELFQCGR
jgi:hypothetical protein